MLYTLAGNNNEKMEASNSLCKTLNSPP